LFGRCLKLRRSFLTPVPSLAVVVCLGLPLLLLSNSLMLEAQISTTAEFRTKANFLAKVPNFIEWSAEALPPGPSPFLICILGDFSFALPLAESVRGKTIQEKQIEVRGVSKEQELHSCHILFVSHFERKSYARMLGSVRGQNVLTIGETPEFLDAGGIVNLSMQEGTLQFDVNLTEANRAHLKMSSRLLALARHVVNPTEAAKN
jgi:hypothetical protein